MPPFVLLPHLAPFLFPSAITGPRMSVHSLSHWFYTYLPSWCWGYNGKLKTRDSWPNGKGWLPVWLNKPLWNDWWSCFHVPPGLCPWRSVGLEHSLQSAQLASFLVRLSTALSLPAPALSSSSPRFSLSIAFITVETTLSLGLFVCLFSLEWNPLKSRDLASRIAHRAWGTSTCLAHAW